MKTPEWAPDRAHILAREGQHLIEAVRTDDALDTAVTLANLAQLVTEMQRELDPRLVENAAHSGWARNGRLHYIRH